MLVSRVDHFVSLTLRCAVDYQGAANWRGRCRRDWRGRNRILTHPRYNTDGWLRRLDFVSLLRFEQFTRLSEQKVESTAANSPVNRAACNRERDNYDCRERNRFASSTQQVTNVSKETANAIFNRFEEPTCS